MELSGHHSWQQALLPPEPSHWFPKDFFFLNGLFYLYGAQKGGLYDSWELQVFVNYSYGCWTPNHFLQNTFSFLKLWGLISLWLSVWLLLRVHCLSLYCKQTTLPVSLVWMQRKVTKWKGREYFQTKWVLRDWIALFCENFWLRKLLMCPHAGGKQSWARAEPWLLGFLPLSHNPSAIHHAVVLSVHLFWM